MTVDENVVITLKDVYREVVQLNGSMKVKDARDLAAEKIDVDHETRLRLLERWRYALPASFMFNAASIAVAVFALFHPMG